MKRQIGVAALVGRMREMQASHIVLERIGAMPGQGTSSMFSFARSVGQLEGVIAALQIPVGYVPPQERRRRFRVKGGKNGSRLAAGELMPRYAERWRRKRDDGRAEASLIVLYGLTTSHVAAPDFGRANGPVTEATAE